MNKNELKRTSKFALWGAIGFGVGGTIGYFIAERISMWDGSYIRYIIWATIGGSLLGFALKDWKDWKRAIYFLAAGAISTWILGELYYRVGGQIFIPFVIGGAAGGASIGLVLGGWGRTGVLTLTGAMGFGIGWVISLWIWMLLFGWSDPGVAAFSLMGAVQGAFVGLSLGVALKGWRMASIVSLGTALVVAILMILREHGFHPILWAVIGIVLLGLVIKDWGKSGLLILSGAISFSVAGAMRQVTDEALSRQLDGWESLIAMAIWGVVGGTLLGIALGYIEKRWPSTNSESD